METQVKRAAVAKIEVGLRRSEKNDGTRMEMTPEHAARMMRKARA